MIVYFIQRGVDGPVKIGTTTKDPLKRLASLQTGSPEPLYLIGCIHGLEADVHTKFREHRISGEWFSPHADILEFIRLNNRPLPAHEDGKMLTFRLSSELRAELELERQRLSELAGAELTLSALIRAMLERDLMGEMEEEEK